MTTASERRNTREQLIRDIRETLMNAITDEGWNSYTKPYDRAIHIKCALEQAGLVIRRDRSMAKPE